MATRTPSSNTVPCRSRSTIGRSTLPTMPTQDHREPEHGEHQRGADATEAGCAWRHGPVAHQRADAEHDQHAEQRQRRRRRRTTTMSPSLVPKLWRVIATSVHWPGRPTVGTRRRAGRGRRGRSRRTRCHASAAACGRRPGAARPTTPTAGDGEEGEHRLGDDELGPRRDARRAAEQQAGVAVVDVEVDQHADQHRQHDHQPERRRPAPTRRTAARAACASPAPGW